MADRAAVPTKDSRPAVATNRTFHSADIAGRLFRRHLTRSTTCHVCTGFEYLPEHTAGRVSVLPYETRSTLYSSPTPSLPHSPPPELLAKPDTSRESRI